MDTKRLKVLALFLMSITFIFWLAAISTPGWIITSPKPHKVPPLHVDYFKPSMISYTSYSSEKDSNSSFMTSFTINSTDNENDVDTGKYLENIVQMPQISVQMSIFYLLLCEKGQCLPVPYGSSGLKVTEYLTSIPSFFEMKIMGVSALVLCITSYILLLLNLKSSLHVLVGGIVMVLACIFSLILAIRMTVPNFEMANLVDAMNMEVNTPYSIILAFIGSLFGFFTSSLIGILYSKLRKQCADDQTLDLISTTSSDNISVLKEISSKT
ncbi:uncharacterized protein LOC134228588 [Saccostrea cucullata]|uniref:uncharacterized protein LOC134228588 n=1 Tax=Saccostrea cuccullata TaxID=36930 RepID=UPI002ED31867